MKRVLTLNKQLVKWFEAEQEMYGTETALYNLLWLKAANDLKGLGVTRVRTTHKNAA